MISIAIHGGAGVIERGKLPAQAEQAYRASLDVALRAGATVLAANGSALDAVEAVVRVLEDNPLFNAGRGAVFTADGRNELDAAIMDGATEKAGAVAGVTRTRHPVSLARAVMEKSPHVMLARDGADRFSLEAGLEQVDPSWFRTEERWQQLQKALAAEQAQASATLPATAYFGTVGAVARDAKGQLAAATSTGGMTNKRWGRIGDAPVIGAGTYASAQCAVSATGWGEFYIRAAVAHDICARMAYRGDSVRAAAEEVVLTVVPALGGDGGVIALDASGRVAMPFNTEGMYRGTIDADGKVRTAIYRDGD